MSPTYPKAQEQLRSCNQPGELHWFSLTPPIHAQARTGSVTTCFPVSEVPVPCATALRHNPEPHLYPFDYYWLGVNPVSSIKNQCQISEGLTCTLFITEIHQVWATAKTSTQERQLESCNRLPTNVMLTFPGYIKPSNIKGHNKLTTPAPQIFL